MFNKFIQSVKAQGVRLDPTYLGEENADNLIKTSTDMGAEESFNYFLLGVADTILYFAAAIAIVALVFGAFQLLRGMGNDEALEKAKTTIKYALGGLVVIIFSYAVVTTLIKLMFEVGG